MSIPFGLIQAVFRYFYLHSLKYILKSFVIALFFLFISQQLFAGTDSLFCRASSPQKARVFAVTTFAGVATVGSITALASAWYKDDASDFTVFNDNDEWKQLDKAGHFASTYNSSMILSDMYRWSGVSERKSKLIGSGVSFFYMGAIEVMDAFSGGYGFSPGDMICNFSGSALAYFNTDKTSRYFPNFKFSYHYTSYAALNPKLLGSNHGERILKDYNGHTYWLTVPGLIKKAPWASLALGYGATEMIRAHDDQNLALGFNPKRSYYLSLDVDLTKIRTSSCLLQRCFSLFRFVKIPFPALELTGKKLSFNAFYF